MVGVNHNIVDVDMEVCEGVGMEAVLTLLVVVMVYFVLREVEP